MDFIVNTLLQVALQAPRIHFRENDAPLYSYEDVRNLNIQNLKGLRKIRSSLTKEELRQLEERERKYFEDVNSLETRKVATSGGTINSDVDVLESVPPLSHDIEVRGLKKFSMPISGWAGPSYSAYRFFNKNEKLTKQDLAAIAISDFDAFSRNHDILYSLISAVPDAEKRKEYKEYVDAIYHTQIYSSFDKPQLSDEFGNVQYALAKFIPAAYAGVRFAANFNEAYRLAQFESREIYRDFINTYNAIQRARGTGLDDPEFSQFRENSGMYEIANGDIHPWINAYLSNIPQYESFFNNRAVQEYTNSPEVLRRLERIGELDLSGAPREAINAEVESLVQENLSFLQRNPRLYIDNNEFLSEPDPETGGDLVLIDETGFIANPNESSRVLSIARESDTATRLLTNKDFWLSMGTAVVGTAVFKYLTERGLNQKMSQDPEFKRQVDESFNTDNLKQGHRGYAKLAELVFRNIGGEIEYNEYSKEELQLYLDSLDFELTNDPLLADIRKMIGTPPKQKEPDPEILKEIERELDSDLEKLEAAFTEDEIYDLIMAEVFD